MSLIWSKPLRILNIRASRKARKIINMLAKSTFVIEKASVIPISPQTTMKKSNLFQSLAK